MNSNLNVVVDNGSGLIKAGFSNEEAPSTVFPTIIRRPVNQGIESDKKDYFVGKNYDELFGPFSLSHPINRGYISDWGDMQKIWEHTFTEELKINIKDHNCIFTQSASNIKREQMASIMFEYFNVKGFYIAIDAVLSLYANGKFSGVVCESGEGVTHLVPIWDGYALPFNIFRMNIGGGDLDSYLIELLSEKGYNFSTPSEKEIVKSIKEKMCYVSLDFIEESNAYSNSISSKEAKYEMPDGKVILMGSERFRCSEVLFQPSLIGYDYEGLHQQIYKIINSSDSFYIKEFFQNIYISGGNTLFNGLPNRLSKELRKICPHILSNKIKINDSPNRMYYAWIGGSILSGLSTFNKMWITKEEYEEIGPEIIHKK